jgi:beta-lactam-binding protein with PASTA domain
MSTKPDTGHGELTQLVERAIVKDRQFLRLSATFTVLVVALGMGWIFYAANRVAKLQKTEADLNLRIASLQREIDIKQQTLLSAEATIQYARDTVEKSNSAAEKKTVLQALSTVQQSVKTAIDAPKSEPVETPSATPTPSAAVPNVKGLGFDAAVQAVRQAGLESQKIDQEGIGSPGTVLYQDPLPGRHIPVKTAVKLYVIPTLTEIPNVKGITLAEAQRKIREAKLTVLVVDQEGRGAPGTVLYQDPLPGRKVRVGTQIKLYVNH